jgi:hypothetical protein
MPSAPVEIGQQGTIVVFGRLSNLLGRDDLLWGEEDILRWVEMEAVALLCWPPSRTPARARPDRVVCASREVLPENPRLRRPDADMEPEDDVDQSRGRVCGALRYKTCLMDDG